MLHQLIFSSNGQSIGRCIALASEAGDDERAAGSNPTDEGGPGGIVDGRAGKQFEKSQSTIHAGTDLD
jgi:hypothetical protein